MEGKGDGDHNRSPSETGDPTTPHCTDSRPLMDEWRYTRGPLGEWYKPPRFRWSDLLRPFPGHRDSRWLEMWGRPR